MRKLEYVNWSTDIFQGFYESGLYNSDTLYNINDEDESNYDFIDGGYEDFTKAVASKCVDLLNDYCRGGLIKHIDFVELYSPKYYNFDTDRLVCKVDCDWQGLVDYCYETCSDFDKYLHDNFTSYSGFTSFVPNNITDFFNKLDDDFERLSQVIIEYYLLNRIDDIDEYRLQCDEIAYETLLQSVSFDPDGDTTVCVMIVAK